MKQSLEHVLKNDEKILWSGQPDPQAIMQTRRSGSGPINIIIAIVFISAFVWLMKRGGTIWTTGPVLTWVWVAVAVMGLWLIYKRLYLDKKKLKLWAESLIYLITDKRILILRGESIDQAPELSQVFQTQIVQRKGVPGFSDLIWEKRAINAHTTNGNMRYISPLEREQAEIGFKALPDAIAVNQILDNWIEQQQLVVQNQDNDSVSQSRTATGANTSNSTISEFHNYVSPCYGYSIGFPTSWEISSRYRKLAFGKWGIEREASWSTPDSKPKWNVLRGQNQINTLVEIQVQEIAAFNTLESLMGTSKVATSLGNGEIVDHEASISINGIPGFYVTRHIGAGATILPTKIKEILSNLYIRKYVLHDGKFQYYIEAMWAVDHQDQQKICEAIIATLKPC